MREKEIHYVKSHLVVVTFNLSQLNELNLLPFIYLLSSLNNSFYLYILPNQGLDMANSSDIEEIRDGVSLTGELMKPQIAGYETTE